MRQLVDSDRKIRALFLLKFSNISLPDIDGSMSDNTTAISDADATADIIADTLTLTVEQSTSDENTIFYVSGAIACCGVHQVRPLQRITDLFRRPTASHLNQQRVGSPGCLVSRQHQLASKFLQSPAQRQLFCRNATYTEKHIHLVFGINMCSVGHDLQSHLVRRFFNCFAKNFVRQITGDANQQSGSANKKRKVAKLTVCVH